MDLECRSLFKDRALQVLLEEATRYKLDVVGAKEVFERE